MKNLIIPYILLALSVLMQSCFEEDQPMTPRPPGEETDIALQTSIYDNQVYFDFGTGEVRAEHPNDSWVMAFDASPEGWQVLVNSGNLLAAAPTGVSSFDEVTSITAASSYFFDASDGNPDSCAFSAWLDRSVDPAKPTGEIFLVGQYDGIKYHPQWRVRIDSADSRSYTVTWAGMKTEPVTITIMKDPDFNFIHVKFENDSLKTVSIEPPKTDWDILLSQYGTTLYTDDGIPTPYFVRGVLLNPYKTEAALESSVPFDSLSWEAAAGLDYSSRRDAIGHDWKEPVINFETNSAEYYVRKDSVFIIHDHEDRYFKMHFLNFYNANHEAGFPEFEYLEL